MNESGINLEIDIVQYLHQHPGNKDNPDHQKGIDLAVQTLEAFGVEGLQFSLNDPIYSAQKSQSVQSPSDRITGNAIQLAQEIRIARKKLGLSQRELAEAAGVSHGYIATLELAKSLYPSKNRLDLVLGALERFKPEQAS